MRATNRLLSIYEIKNLEPQQNSSINQLLRVYDQKIEPIQNIKDLELDLKIELKKSEIKEINTDIANLKNKEEITSKKLQKIEEMLKEIDALSQYDTYVPTDRLLERIKEINSQIRAFQLEGVKKENIVSTKDIFDVPMQYFRSLAYGDAIFLIGKETNKSIKISNELDSGFGKLAQKLNSVYKDELKAQAEVIYKAFDDPLKYIKSGITPSEFFINGVQINQVSIQEKDSNNALKNAINSYTNQTGVIASTDENGIFMLKSIDGRAIEISGNLNELAKLNLVDENKIAQNIPSKPIADFKGGDTLTSYSFSLDGTRELTRIEIEDYDGDNGKYNVYVKRRDTSTLIARNVEASGNNESKINIIETSPILADKIVIKPLDEQGREDTSGGLGGWWFVDIKSIQTNINALITIGKLELEKDNKISYIGSNELEYLFDKKEEVIKYSDITKEPKSLDDLSVHKKILSTLADNLKEMLAKTREELSLKLLKVDETLLDSSTTNRFDFEPNRAIEIIKSHASDFIKAQEIKNKEQIYKLLFSPLDYEFLPKNGTQKIK